MPIFLPISGPWTRSSAHSNLVHLRLSSSPACFVVLVFRSCPHTRSRFLIQLSYTHATIHSRNARYGARYCPLPYTTVVPTSHSPNKILADVHDDTSSIPPHFLRTHHADIGIPLIVAIPYQPFPPRTRHSPTQLFQPGQAMPLIPFCSCVCLRLFTAISPCVRLRRLYAPAFLFTLRSASVAFKFVPAHRYLPTRTAPRKPPRSLSLRVLALRSLGFRPHHIG
ncbi:hypothetical protein V8D89_006067 [Ganoderma adspersum]